MAPYGTWDDFNNQMSNAVNSISDEIQGSNGYKFEVRLGREPPLPPWAFVAIGLCALGLLVCLVVLCCRCCCREERGRVLIVPQPIAPQQPMVTHTQYIPGHYPVSPTPLVMQQPGTAATHGTGAGGYPDYAKSTSSPPPQYDQEVLVQLNDTHKYPLLK